MSDPAEQQAAVAEFLTELALLHLRPEPLPQPAGFDQALVQMAAAMNVLYGGQRG